MGYLIAAFLLISILQFCVLITGSYRHAWIPVRTCRRSCGSRLFGIVPDESTGQDHRPDVSEEDLPFTALAESLSDPYSDAAKSFCTDQLRMNEQQVALIRAYVEEIISWNERVNLVSRRTCTPESIFARHIVPSLVGGRILEESLLNNHQGNDDALRIIDVGTGGGFPGMPLAILFPQIQFVLADSIGKKVTAVTAMAKDLKLPNVATYNGRVEDYFSSTPLDGNANTRRKFDIVTGRSVTSLPKFCSLVRDLLDPKHGHVLYLTGGEIDPAIVELSIRNTAIEEFLSPYWSDSCDKRVLIFPYAAVRAISALLPNQEPRNLNASASKQRQSRLPNGPGRGPNEKRPKGAWQKKNDPDQPKQRGYENFQRYTSPSPSED